LELVEQVEQVEQALVIREPTVETLLCELSQDLLLFANTKAHKVVWVEI
jgi:hypothetical protein